MEYALKTKEHWIRKQTRVVDVIKQRAFANESFSEELSNSCKKEKFSDLLFNRVFRDKRHIKLFELSELTFESFFLNK